MLQLAFLVLAVSSSAQDKPRCRAMGGCTIVMARVPFGTNGFTQYRLAPPGSMDGAEELPACGPAGARYAVELKCVQVPRSCSGATVYSQVRQYAGDAASDLDYTEIARDSLSGCAFRGGYDERAACGRFPAQGDPGWNDALNHALSCVDKLSISLFADLRFRSKDREEIRQSIKGLITPYKTLFLTFRFPAARAEFADALKATAVDALFSAVSAGDARAEILKQEEASRAPR